MPMRELRIQEDSWVLELIMRGAGVAADGRCCEVHLILAPEQFHNYLKKQDTKGDCDADDVDDTC